MKMRLNSKKIVKSEMKFTVMLTVVTFILLHSEWE